MEREFFQEFNEKTAKEWRGVYNQTSERIRQEIAERQVEEREQVEKGRERSEKIGQDLIESQEALGRTRSRRGRAELLEAIESLEQEQETLNKDLREKVNRLEAESDPVTIDKLAQERMEKEHPELVSRMRMLEEIAQQWEKAR